MSTHDTKRGEDVRARIAVLAEVPDVWAAGLDSLLALAPLPDPSFGNLLWQAVLGAWPASRERLHAYAEKAMREAGDWTTWTAPDVEYEKPCTRPSTRPSTTRVTPRSSRTCVDARRRPGWSNALSAQAASQLTMPGVPDVYQGSELWEQSLVDPDNRRPVDFALRRGCSPSSTSERRGARDIDDAGAAKLLVTAERC